MFGLSLCPLRLLLCDVSFEYNAGEPCNVLTLLASLEESGTGISHEVGLAALGTAINDSAAPTYINRIFTLSLISDMPTNKARTSDNAQKQSASNAVPIFYSVFLIFQTSKRYDFHSVWACVSHAATCHDNHQVGFAQRHLLFCLIYVNNSYCNRDLIMYAKLVIFSYICKQKLIFVDI